MRLVEQNNPRKTLWDNKVVRSVISLLATFGIIGLICGGLMFYWITKVDYKYTGEQLFEAINQHRVAVGSPALKLDADLCDNLVERWLAIKEPSNGHKGFEEWVLGEGIDKNPKFGIIGEVYVKDISTPQNAINFWVGSPGHKDTLERPDMYYGCAYANDGAGVVIMATKKTVN